MIITSLGLEFTLSGINLSSTSAWWENVYQPSADVVKCFKANRDQVPLLHVVREPLQSHEVLAADYKESFKSIQLNPAFYDAPLHNNFPVADDSYSLVAGPIYESYSSDILITNRFINNQPLFWADELPFQALGYPIAVQDPKGNVLPSESYKVFSEPHPSTGGTVRAIIAHSIDAKESPYSLIYQTDARRVITRALNQSALYHKAGTRDVGLSGTSYISDSSFAYLISTSPGGFAFNIPNATLMAVKPKEQVYLHAELPASVDPSEAWHVAVSRSTLKADSAFYSVPEWDYQAFDLYAPFCRVNRDHAEVLNKNLLRVSWNHPHTSLLTPSGASRTSFINIYEYDEGFQLKGGVSNNTALKDVHIGTSTCKWETDFFSVVHQKGWIKTNRALYPSCRYLVDYSYEADGVPVIARDLNPWRDPSLRGKTFVPYLVPKTLTYPYQTNAIEYVLYDEDGIITTYSQDGSGRNSAVTASGYYFRSPSLTNSISDSNTLGLHFELGTSFLQRYCLGYGTGTYLVLGEFTLPERLGEEDKTLLTDVRRSPYAGEGEAFKSSIDCNPDFISYGNQVNSLDRVILPIQGAVSVLGPWSKTEIEVEHSFRQTMNAGLMLVYENRHTPQLRVSTVSPTALTLTLAWNPVPYIGTDFISGVFYQGTTLNGMTAAGTFSNLYWQTSTAVSVSTAALVNYYQIEPYYTNATATSTGTRSNIVSFTYRQSA